jgi:hypothetical protein
VAAELDGQIIWKEEKNTSKAIIAAAITGSNHTPTMTPYLRLTPDQIADEKVND